MVDFAAHLPFTLLNRLLKMVHFTWKMLSLAIFIYSSLEFPHAASSREKIQDSLVVENSFSGISLKYGRFKNTGSCPKSSSTHQ